METDWLKLWRELVITASPFSSRECVSRYEAYARRKKERPDDLLSFVLARTNNRHTVLDIGAGSGRWTIPLASVAGKVTAVEPSEAMRNILRQSIDNAGVDNIRIVASAWEESDVEPHDIIVSAHAMYSSPDFSSFVRRMEQYAREACYLALRLPARDGIINELSLLICGRYHDSPNAIIAYNALYSMGIYANVLVENRVHRWTNENLDDAFDRAKRHLHLEASSLYDELIRDTLARRLIVSDNGYTWPDGMRSTLLWWAPSSTPAKESSGD